MESGLATALGDVVTTLTSAAADLTAKVPVVAGIGIGVGLIGFGIRYLVGTFKGTAR